MVSKEIARLEKIANSERVSQSERLGTIYKIYWLRGIRNSYVAEVVPESFKAQFA